MKTLITSTAFVALIILGFSIWNDTPVVYKSASSNSSWSEATCVKVESDNPEWDCENLPVKYTPVWSE